MRVTTVLPATLLGLSYGIDSALAWGVAGHQIVATIAQVHLHPSTRQAIADILPDWTGGQLAKIAAWPDRVRPQYPWSGQLHYVNLAGTEHPPDSCPWPGSPTSQNNVLNAIQNYTVRVAQDRQDIDLRFLVHYVGDVHQPLHLTGRNSGGNKDPIVFEGRHMSLHGLWDTQLLTKYIREFRNYTQPLPSNQIESALTGSIYDPYVRWVIWEGIREWWVQDLPSWLACPAESASLASSAFGPTSQITFGHSSLLRTNAMLAGVACPVHWAKEPHSYNCGYVYPSDFDSSSGPYVVPSNYVSKVSNDKIVESLLAKGGIRLAAILNTILADDAELRTLGLINTAAHIEQHGPATGLEGNRQEWIDWANRVLAALAY